MRVTLASSPEVKAVILAADSTYRKREASICEFHPGININSFWDGGSKSYFHIVELATNRVKPLPSSTHPFFDMHSASGQTPDVVIERGNVDLMRLPEGFALVQTGIFCGKTGTATVFLNPANMAKLLPAPTPTRMRVVIVQRDRVCDCEAFPFCEHAPNATQPA